MRLSLMLSNLLIVFAQEASRAAGTGPAGAPAGPLEWLYSFLPIVAMLFLFYFVFWRPMQRDKKQRESLLNQINKNDDVLLTSGIYGSVISVAEDKDEITVKIADNTRIRVIKSAIARNITKEEALTAQKDTPATPTPPKEGTT